MRSTPAAAHRGAVVPREPDAVTQREHGDAIRVGPEEQRLLGHPRIIADHADELSLRLVAVADGAVSHQAATDGVAQVGQLGFDVNHAGAGEH